MQLLILLHSVKEFVCRTICIKCLLPFIRSIRGVSVCVNSFFEQIYQFPAEFTIAFKRFFCLPFDFTLFAVKQIQGLYPLVKLFEPYIAHHTFHLRITLRIGIGCPGTCRLTGFLINKCGWCNKRYFTKIFMLILSRVDDGKAGISQASKI